VNFNEQNLLIFEYFTEIAQLIIDLFRANVQCAKNRSAEDVRSTQLCTARL